MKTKALFLAMLAAFAGGGAAFAATPKIGVYYYPGWSNDPNGIDKTDSWRPLRAFPEREPLMGWYAGSSRATLQQQADTMQAAHIDFVAFDWYYEHGRVELDGPLNGYIALGTARPKISLLWANHGAHTTTESWHAIVDAWAGYFAKAGFFKINGANVIFVFNGQRFADDATAAGASATAWTGYAQSEMRRRGLPPIYFVAGVFGGTDTIIPNAIADGFSSISSYNIHHLPDDPAEVQGYPNLDSAYRVHWQRMARFAPKLKPIVPITAGWDHRPWGPMPARDGSIATPAQFAQHLKAARDFMTAKQLDAGVICCWNEYGEGTFIEPTKRYGKAMLDDVTATFAH